MSSPPTFLLLLCLVESCAYAKAFPFLPSINVFLGEFRVNPGVNIRGTIYDLFRVKEDRGAVYIHYYGSYGLNCGSELRSKSGTVTSYQSKNTEHLQKVEEVAGQSKLFGATYKPVYVVITTWNNVGTTKDADGNTFQLVFANDGKTYFVLMDFASFSERTVTVTTEVKLNIGTSIDVLDYYCLTLTDLTTNSNTNVPGRYLFRVDQQGIKANPISEKCRGVCIEKRCLCKPDEFFSLSQERCVSALECGFCGKVGEYVEYPKVWWDGPERLFRSQSLMSDATTARADCQAQCTADTFCVAFSLRQTSGSVKCVLLQSFFEAGEFNYDRDGATFFHKKCK